MSRRKLTPEEAELTGAAKHNRKRYQEPDPENMSYPDPPPHVEMDDRLGVIWDKLVTDLENISQLHSADREIMAAYCVCRQAFLDCWEKTQENNYWIERTDHNGNLTGFVRAPWCTSMERYGTLCIRYLNDLGLTVSSRRKLGISFKKPEQTGEAPKVLGARTSSAPPTIPFKKNG